MKDLLLIRKLKLKEEKTFAKFFESYKNLVFYEANMILNNRSDAEDITQEVFIEFFNRVDELKDSTNVKLYIAALAKRRAIDLYRKNSNSHVSFIDNIESYADIEAKVEPTLTLDGLLEVKEAHIVNLKVVYGFSFKEIANDLKMTLGQVQGIFYQAIKKLKKHYKKGK